MDDQERAALRATRDLALADRERLDVVIAYLSEQLGEAPPDGNGGGRSTAPPSGLVGTDPVVGTAEGEYLNMQSTKAAYQVLAKFGDKQHALSTKQLFDAIKRGGVKIGSEDSLYRSLHRSHKFQKAGRNKWGLAEWYPPKATTGRRNPDNVSSLPDSFQGADDEISDDESTEVQAS